MTSKVSPQFNVLVKQKPNWQQTPDICGVPSVPDKTLRTENVRVWPAGCWSVAARSKAAALLLEYAP